MTCAFASSLAFHRLPARSRLGSGRAKAAEILLLCGQDLRAHPLLELRAASARRRPHQRHGRRRASRPRLAAKPDAVAVASHRRVRWSALRSAACRTRRASARGATPSCCALGCRVVAALPQRRPARGPRTRRARASTGRAAVPPQCRAADHGGAHREYSWVLKSKARSSQPAGDDGGLPRQREGRRRHARF